MISRRSFLRLTGATTSGLFIGISDTFGLANVSESSANGQTFELNAVLSVNSDGGIYFTSVKHEMGQGISHGLSTVVAEELGAQFSDIEVKFADYFEGCGFSHWEFKTGGSVSMKSQWAGLRTAAAAAREMIIESAAQVWKVPTSECTTANSRVRHVSSNRELSFADVAELAGSKNVPKTPKLKSGKKYSWIGKDTLDKSQLDIVEGKAEYGMDFRIDGMLYASIERAPVLNAQLVQVNSKKAEQFPGVKKVIQIKGSQVSDRTTLQDSVAVIANSTWAAMEGRKLLDITWDFGELSSLSQSEHEAHLNALVQKPGKSTLSIGSPVILDKTEKKISAIYHTPNQAHATMEPLNATVRVTSDGAEVWAGNQDGMQIAADISKVTGVPFKNIRVHNLRSGGAFGRRFVPDYFVEAAAIANEVRGTAVKLVFSRIDDIKYDAFHQSYASLQEAGVNKDTCEAWHYNWAAPDSESLNWNSYEIVNKHASAVVYESPVQIGPWRSVQAHLWAFSQECFLDEIAHTIKKDPAHYRLDLLKKDRSIDIQHWGGEKLDTKRLREITQLAIEKSKWGEQKNGVYQGIASYPFMHGNSYCSVVIEVSLQENKIQLERVVAAVDCGLVVNPSKTIGQVEGGIIWALSAAMFGEITLEKGRVNQSNFHDYRVLRMSEIPKMEIHFQSEVDTPCGIGETAVPPVAPALFNAVFAATGDRLRTLPLSKSKYL